MLRVGFLLVCCKRLLGRSETLDEFHLGGMVGGKGSWGKGLGDGRDVGKAGHTFVDLAETLPA